eukprot:CAMPEP_0117490278 /NCGR_PEP_ID=MMETSP0784-20121206/17470_1 /TAXON_ID=39447 /ORGANISM="" /LENGTH=60 /DNA_ID=CAMNT_0005285035 /DNA_START=556 /DNA_END=735 /DNA_ORIENTATION=-
MNRGLLPSGHRGMLHALAGVEVPRINVSMATTTAIASGGVMLSLGTRGCEHEEPTHGLEP